MTHDDIKAVVAKVPGLNAFGVGVYFDVRPSDREVWFQSSRDELLGDVDGCSRAEAWLQSKVRTKAVNRRWSSYGLKHLAEEEVGYVTNGAFIAAAVHCGFPVAVSPDSPNVLVGISERSLKAGLRGVG
jgi:hypothetical protein